MAKIILAVSGGVDSIVMLDLIAKYYSSGDIIVAHFNHGIRNDSDKDAQFVANISKDIYHIRCIIGEEKLAQSASEETARRARYDFLRQIAAKNPGAKIYTAHHLDDLVETVIINFLRGTGWRGLAALDTPKIHRPLLNAEIIYEPMDKAAIMEYAARRGLHWREDSTNSSSQYLRNRVRDQLREARLKTFNIDNQSGSNSDYRILDFEQKLKLWQLWQQQKILKREIDALTQELTPEPDIRWQRDWFKKLDQASALELLRAGTLQAGISATRPQLEAFRQAILAYAPGKYFNLPGDNLIKINKHDFHIPSRGNSCQSRDDKGSTIS